MERGFANLYDSPPDKDYSTIDSKINQKLQAEKNVSTFIDDAIVEQSEPITQSRRTLVKFQDKSKSKKMVCLEDSKINLGSFDQLKNKQSTYDF